MISLLRISSPAPPFDFQITTYPLTSYVRAQVVGLTSLTGQASGTTPEKQQTASLVAIAADARRSQ